MEIGFKKSLIFFFLICSICAITFLHRNYVGLHHFSFVEWLVNYQHSFVRRGIFGELNYNMAKIFNLNLLKVTLTLQIILFCIFYYYSTKILINIKKPPFLLILAIFSPVGFIFPLGEIEALGRQEIVFLAFLSFYMWFLIFKNKIFLSQILLITLLPIILLAHEGMILYFSYVIIANLFFLYSKEIKFSLLINILITSYIIIIFLVFNSNYNVDIAAVDGICESLSEYIKPSHCVGINGIFKISETKGVTIDQFISRFELFKVLKFSLFAIVGFVPLLMVVKNRKNFKIFNFEIKPLYTIYVCVFCSLPIYLAIDWGRWTYVNYISTLFLIIYLLHIKFLEIKKEKIYYFFEEITSKTKVLFFIVFCLSWNLKILYTDDIGSFPAYRLIIKTTKYLLSF